MIYYSATKRKRVALVNCVPLINISDLIKIFVEHATRLSTVYGGTTVFYCNIMNLVLVHNKLECYIIPIKCLKVET